MNIRLFIMNELYFKQSLKIISIQVTMVNYYVNSKN